MPQNIERETSLQQHWSYVKKRPVLNKFQGRNDTPLPSRPIGGCLMNPRLFSRTFIHPFLILHWVCLIALTGFVIVSSACATRRPAIWIAFASKVNVIRNWNRTKGKILRETFLLLKSELLFIQALLSLWHTNGVQMYIPSMSYLVDICTPLTIASYYFTP